MDKLTTYYNLPRWTNRPRIRGRENEIHNTLIRYLNGGISHTFKTLGTSLGHCFKIQIQQLGRLHCFIISFVEFNILSWICDPCYILTNPY